ncbi:MAG: bifunctional precorrin-2 dehydrogenase/sirohydrochlorin ferrochelatase [Candidatus Omnitrophica bacterium]|nr:bifunctional precorrin-2 dehydrogenase/sirohydrochlorin ferrochelatase [Candidatus Omnitrophota bacterium]
MAVINYYPAFLNLKGRKALLLGGGEVALRKARVLVRSGAKLEGISRDFSPAFLRFAKSKRIRIRYGSKLPKSLKGVWLVVAATSDEALNERIYRKCVRENIFVNVVDDPKHCTFIVPSIVRRGALQIAISTGGASPFLAKMLRKKLEVQFGSSYGKLVQSLGREREKAKRLIKFGKERRNHLIKLVKNVWS